MCGIAGIFSKNKVDKLEQRIVNMGEVLYHRGPDSGSFIIISDKVAFAHRRLAIIDLDDRSNQPMKCNNGRYTLVFNGEIYNFREIKAQLTYSFKTNSDTEVILAAIEEKGVEWFLNIANGMFAIGVYDNKEKSIYLIRDRFGVKPLFYSLTNNTFIFSSEIKSILKSGLIEAHFNEDAIDNYLANRYVREPYTFFSGIYQVKSGSFLVVNSKLDVKEERYWNLPDMNFDTEYNEEEIVSLLDVELTNAIKRRLISDVKLGSYLSGGVDSSLITAIATTLMGEPINTYTIGFQEEGFNEFEYSKMIADRYNTKHHIINMGAEDYIDKWNSLIWFKDAPLGVPNEVPLAIMSEKLKEDITVVLSGEGADELFGGYGRIFQSAFEYSSKNEKIEFYKYFIDKYEYVPRRIRDNVLNTGIKLREEFDSVNRRDIFNKYSNEEAIFKFFYESHIKGLLNRLDMTTMEASVEGRVPFLDYQLVEFVFKSIPYNLKLKWKDDFSENIAMKMSSNEFSEKLDIPKYILKKLSYKYLPNKVIERKKMGFPVPLSRWFGDLEKLAYESLSDAYWIKDNRLKEIIESSKSSERSGQLLWMFINIEMFRKKYFTMSWKY